MINRIVLAEHFKDLGYKIGAEIGVCDGYYSEVLCEQIPGLKLYCVDIWEPYNGYSDYTRWLTFEGMIKKATERLAKYNCEFIKKYSMDAVKDFKDESLDFVYIDANHKYEYVRDDIREWGKKVRKGGIIAGHDYYVTKSGNVGVMKAVDEYVAEHGCKLKLTDWRRHLERRDNQQPSWYFTKTW